MGTEFYGVKEVSPGGTWDPQNKGRDPETKPEVTITKAVSIHLPSFLLSVN